MNTSSVNANDSATQKLDVEPREESAGAQVDELEIEVRELQRPVRPRGVLAE